jgi:hypothetical protein
VEFLGVPKLAAAPVYYGRDERAPDLMSGNKFSE